LKARFARGLLAQRRSSLKLMVSFNRRRFAQMGDAGPPEGLPNALARCVFSAQLNSGWVKIRR
jgi:hypothetical protein